MADSKLVELLHSGRAREQLQTRFYRALAGAAEDRSDAPVADRLNGLLADEQHHLSRLTARLLEYGEKLEHSENAPGPTPWDGWEDAARDREREEIAWYEAALKSTVLDPLTRSLFEEILDSERKHHEELGGKWMSA